MNTGAFNVGPEVFLGLRLLSFLFVLFSVFHSVAGISTVLSSGCLLMSRAVSPPSLLFSLRHPSKGGYRLLNVARS